VVFVGDIAPLCQKRGIITTNASSLSCPIVERSLVFTKDSLE